MGPLPSLKTIMTSTLYVFTDGSAIRNGKKGCRAAWSNYVGENDHRNKSGVVTSVPSNQIAELTAIEKALCTILEAVERRCVIVTDSKYSFDCLTKWHRTWERNGYRTKNGAPVKHSDTISRCVELIKTIRKTKTFDFMHVNSHLPKPKGDGDVFDVFVWSGNAMADTMAKRALTTNRVAAARSTM